MRTLSDGTLVDVLGGIVDNSRGIQEIEKEMVRRWVRGKVPRPVLGFDRPDSDVDLVMQQYRCEIVRVIADTLTKWKAASE
jgi:hypothetical protein